MITARERIISLGVIALCAALLALWVFGVALFIFAAYLLLVWAQASGGGLVLPIFCIAFAIFLVMFIDRAKRERAT